MVKYEIMYAVRVLQVCSLRYSVVPTISAGPRHAKLVHTYISYLFVYTVFMSMYVLLYHLLYIDLLDSSSSPLKATFTRLHDVIPLKLHQDVLGRVGPEEHDAGHTHGDVAQGDDPEEDHVDHPVN